MKVLHSISSLDPAAGGPVVALLGLVRAQTALGLDVNVVATRSPAAASQEGEFEASGARLTLIDASRGRARFCISSVAALRRAVHEADVVHSHGLWELIPTVASAIAWKSRRPFIVRPCGMLDSWSLSQNRWVKRAHFVLITSHIIKHAALLHATTDRERMELLAHDLGTAVVVVPNGVDDSAFETTQLATAAGFEQLQQNRKIILFLGRVHPKKGLDVLIPALSWIHDRDAILVIVGPAKGHHFIDVQREIRRLELTNRVSFVEPLYGPERFAAYRAAKLFVLPSKQENFGITVAEAMASGIPVIVSPEVALSDTVNAEQSGLVVPRDPVQLAAAINRLLGDQSERARLGENGKRVASELFRWSVIGKRWSAIYGRLLAPAR